jgi:predicted DCC family thiol-disulfide oxidoreductase YuxK
MQPGIILFDGVCNLCNGFVDFIIRFDKHKKFKLGALQSKEGLSFLEEYGRSEHALSSVVLIYSNNFYTESRAVLEIFRLLGGFWKLFYVFILIPAFLRDPVYRWIAKNRYAWFGQKNSCRMPDPETRARFI